MSVLHMDMMEAANVPVPGLGEAVLFVGMDGRLAAKVAGGAVVQVLQGATGENGEPGVPGVKGDKGDAGDDGAQGVPGVKGDKGDDGADGAQGLPGVKGDKGDAGDDGAQGVPGVKGDKGDAGADGADGAQGLPGVKGDKGDAGQAGFNSVIETATLGQARPGSAALVIASRPAGDSLVNKMVRVRAVVDTTAAANMTFAVNCGGLIFTFAALVLTGSRRNIFEATCFVGSTSALSAGFNSQAATAVGGTGNSLKGSAAISGAVGGAAVTLTLSSVGQTCTTRLAQIEVI